MNQMTSLQAPAPSRTKQGAGIRDRLCRWRRCQRSWASTRRSRAAPSPERGRRRRRRRDACRGRRLSRKGSVRGGDWNAGVAQNFIEGRREQGFLLAPDVREWLPADHLAWFVIDAVAEMDLSAFYGAYRADGHGRAAYEPSLMVALVLYAFATRQRSSRAIERHCRQDVAYRVISGNLVPDHATIARFIFRHERALGDLFGDVLKLCDRAGLVKPGVVSIDGTRIAGNASPEVNHLRSDRPGDPGRGQGDR
jgi:transposase